MAITRTSACTSIERGLRKWQSKSVMALKESLAQLATDGSRFLIFTATLLTRIRKAVGTAGARIATRQAASNSGRAVKAGPWPKNGLQIGHWFVLLVFFRLSFPEVTCLQSRPLYDIY
jgi:hypothetical protein